MTNLLTVGTQIDVRAMLTRMIDFLKMQDITALFTSLTSAGSELDDDRDHDLVADGHVGTDCRSRKPSGGGSGGSTC